MSNAPPSGGPGGGAVLFEEKPMKTKKLGKNAAKRLLAGRN